MYKRRKYANPELNDLEEENGYTKIKGEHRDRILEWTLRHSQRITISDKEVVKRRGRSEDLGIRKGFW